MSRAVGRQTEWAGQKWVVTARTGHMVGDRQKCHCTRPEATSIGGELARTEGCIWLGHFRHRGLWRPRGRSPDMSSAGCPVGRGHGGSGDVPLDSPVRRAGRRG